MRCYTSFNSLAHRLHHRQSGQPAATICEVGCFSNRVVLDVADSSQPNGIADSCAGPTTPASKFDSFFRRQSVGVIIRVTQRTIHSVIEHTQVL